MEILTTPALLAAAFAVALLAGTVKGATGFAMPTILISGLSLFLDPRLALAALIVPTFVTNGMQALRLGIGAARETVRRFRLFLGAGLICLALSAQLVAVVPDRALFLMIGIPVALFAMASLVGFQPRLSPRNRLAEGGVGAFSGFIGGLSGIWGPPTVMYLTAIGLEKRAHVQTQGVIYALGALALMGAHFASGVLTFGNLPLGVLLLVPAIAGMLIGQRIQDRIDQAQFRRLVLAVLLIAGANLMRKGLVG